MELAQVAMGIKTSIGWCDSTVNGQEGCDGCELWKPGDGGTCYAGGMIRRWANSVGHPDAFEKPEIYPHRIVSACAWPDLTGTERPEKPWLNGHPRFIFFDDLGDTYTETLDNGEYMRGLLRKALAGAGPAGLRRRIGLFEQAVSAVLAGGHWLDPFIPMIAASPHIWLFLTKRPRRMRLAFERLGGIPANVWPMTSVTGRGSLARVRELLKIPGASQYGVSYEPARPGVDFTDLMYRVRCPQDPAAPCDGYEGAMTKDGCCPKCDLGMEYAGPGITWLIFGGGSGAGEQVCEISSLRAALAVARDADAAPFMKQAGRRCRMLRADSGPARAAGAKIEDDDGLRVVVTFKNPKGEDPAEWPRDLASNTRQVPQEWRE